MPTRISSPWSQTGKRVQPTFPDGNWQADSLPLADDESIVNAALVLLVKETCDLAAVSILGVYMEACLAYYDSMTTSSATSSRIAAVYKHTTQRGREKSDQDRWSRPY
jgi:hypothetical protein